MPVEELVEIGARVGLKVAAEFPQLIFNRHVARYFHGIGRRVIALLTFSGVRIPSSLRIIPEGQSPKPRNRDWWALGIGVGVWSAAVAGVILALF